MVSGLIMCAERHCCGTSIPCFLSMSYVGNLSCNKVHIGNLFGVYVPKCAWISDLPLGIHFLLLDCHGLI